MSLNNPVALDEVGAHVSWERDRSTSANFNFIFGPIEPTWASTAPLCAIKATHLNPSTNLDPPSSSHNCHVSLSHTDLPHLSSYQADNFWTPHGPPPSRRTRGIYSIGRRQATTAHHPSSLSPSLFSSDFKFPLTKTQDHSPDLVDTCYLLLASSLQICTFRDWSSHLGFVKCTRPLRTQLSIGHLLVYILNRVRSTHSICIHEYSKPFLVHFSFLATS